MPSFSRKWNPVDAVAPAVSRRMAATRGRDNAGERALRSELHRRGLRFRVHYGVLEGTRRTVDIAFPRAKVAVFRDGCFWHGCPIHGTQPRNNAAWWRAKIEGNQARDRDTDARLRKLGWRVIRVWEHDTTAADRIAAVVSHRLQTRKRRP